MADSSLKFLADENVSHELVTILRKLGAGSIISLSRTPDVGTADDHWIPLYTDRGFVILTPDREQLRDDVILNAIRDCGARMVFLPRHFADSKRWDQALWFLKYWWKLAERCAVLKPGELVRFHKYGTHTVAR